MDITQIPFTEKVGIKRNQDGQLLLDFEKSVQNHLQTIHASALFTLAESASGEMLQITFPEFADKVIPVLRDAQIKFKRPATKLVVAYPSISKDDINKFKEQMNKKGRSLLTVNVHIKDLDNTLIFAGSFSWFIQSL
jgi:acyl-coenzyme A thioesterase PaaI-like protein